MRAIIIHDRKEVAMDVYCYILVKCFHMRYDEAVEMHRHMKAAGYYPVKILTLDVALTKLAAIEPTVRSLTHDMGIITIEEVEVEAQGWKQG